MKYSPTPLSDEALPRASTKASEGYPPVAKSAEAAYFGTWMTQTRLTHSSTGKARACTPKCLPLPKRFVQVFRHAGVVFCVGG